MTREDLFAAIGEVGDTRLEKLEYVSKRGGRSILLRCGLAAAVVTILATAVFAIPAARNALFGGKAELTQTGGIYGAEGRHYDDIYAVRLNVEASPDAPDTIERYYLPMELAESWSLCDGSNVLADAAYFAWDNYDLGIYAIFSQQSAKHYDSSSPFDRINVSADTEVAETTVEHNGRTLYRFEVAPSETNAHGEVYFYWSDGDYIFRLVCPASLTGETVFSILDSVAPVEDISRYCPPNGSVPYEEVKPTFTRHDMPSYLPEGFTLHYGDVENGCARFLWTRDNSMIQYGQYTWDVNTDIYIAWERDVEQCPREIVEIGGSTVTIYAQNGGYGAYWEADGYDCYLGITDSASYDARVELEKIIAGVRPVEDIAPYRKNLVAD